MQSFALVLILKLISRTTNGFHSTLKSQPVSIVMLHTNLQIYVCWCYHKNFFSFLLLLLCHDFFKRLIQRVTRMKAISCTHTAWKWWMMTRVRHHPSFLSCVCATTCLPRRHTLNPWIDQISIVIASLVSEKSNVYLYAFLPPLPFAKPLAEKCELFKLNRIHSFYKHRIKGYKVAKFLPGSCGGNFVYTFYPYVVVFTWWCLYYRYMHQIYNISSKYRFAYVLIKILT